MTAFAAPRVATRRAASVARPATRASVRESLQGFRGALRRRHREPWLRLRRRALPRPELTAVTESAPAARTPGRLIRALVAYSTHTAEHYLAVWGPSRSTAPIRLVEPPRL
jgi:hypothetical protein